MSCSTVFIEASSCPDGNKYRDLHLDAVHQDRANLFLNGTFPSNLSPQSSESSGRGGRDIGTDSEDEHSKETKLCRENRTSTPTNSQRL